MAKSEVSEGIEAAIAGLSDAMNHLADASDRLATVYEDMIERGGVAATVEDKDEEKSAPKAKPAAKKEKAKEPEPEEAKEAEEDDGEAADIEAVRDAVRTTMAALGKEDVFKILGEYGADSVSALKEKDYAAVISDCEAAIASDPSA